MKLVFREGRHLRMVKYILMEAMQFVLVTDSKSHSRNTIL